jgi:hypothetical protein
VPTPSANRHQIIGIDVLPGRDRSLGGAEITLHHRVKSNRRDEKLSLALARVAHFRHSESVSKDHLSVPRAWGELAAKTAIRLEPGSGKFGFGPVTHELHGSLAGDDEIGASFQSRLTLPRSVMSCL